MSTVVGRVGGTAYEAKRLLSPTHGGIQAAARESEADGWERAGRVFVTDIEGGPYCQMMRRRSRSDVPDGQMSLLAGCAMRGWV